MSRYATSERARLVTFEFRMRFPQRSFSVIRATPRGVLRDLLPQSKNFPSGEKMAQLNRPGSHSNFDHATGQPLNVRGRWREQRRNFYFSLCEHVRELNVLYKRSSSFHFRSFTLRFTLWFRSHPVVGVLHLLHRWNHAEYVKLRGLLFLIKTNIVGARNFRQQQSRHHPNHPYPHDITLPVASYHQRRWREQQSRPSSLVVTAPNVPSNSRPSITVSDIPVSSVPVAVEHGDRRRPTTVVSQSASSLSSSPPPPSAPVEIPIFIPISSDTVLALTRLFPGVDFNIVKEELWETLGFSSRFFFVCFPFLLRARFSFVGLSLFGLLPLLLLLLLLLFYPVTKKIRWKQMIWKTKIIFSLIWADRGEKLKTGKRSNMRR